MRVLPLVLGHGVIQADYRGARGANAGDDFHELWALQQALTLLNTESDLTFLTLEGLPAYDEAGAPIAAWDGVDCAFYYGGETVASCKRIIIDQLKYSGAAPQTPWTVARLTQNTRRSGNNSLIRRLADAFREILSKRGSADGLAVRLVSNQPVDSHVIEILRNSSTPSLPSHEGTEERSELTKASGLRQELFGIFARSLDLSCRTGSRFQLEEGVLRLIASWTDDDARSILNTLLRFVGRRMLPEAKGERITLESLLYEFGSSKRALFPCPSQLRPIDDPVPRPVASAVVDQFQAGEKFICMHGSAGCGKTTALQEIATALPEASAMIVFDCYGSGRYLDSDAYRHRPQDAFLQLSNEVASRVGVPLLLTRSEGADYPRSFQRRLTLAADALAAKNRDAFLVVAIDAADNSITAAESLAPPDRSFVRDFVRIGEIAPNVRLMLTARTSRINELHLPPQFTLVEVKNFTPEETKLNVSRAWSDCPSSWLEDFHHFSDGNPRVQAYAIEYGAGDPNRALDSLRPQGKALTKIFEERLTEALRKSGSLTTIDDFCGALISLPRPIPLEDLAGIARLTVAQLQDIIADLAPALPTHDNQLGFADEDFEHFVRDRIEARLGEFRSRVADWFVQRRHANAYAAEHVAAALYDAGRGREVTALLEEESAPAAIHDPLLQQEAQARRFRVAMRVATHESDMAHALRTMLYGAGAMKTDEAIRELVVDNPDLAALFMSDSAARLLLLDAEQPEHHGRLLFHLMLKDAHAGNGVMAREDRRQLDAWLQRRRDDHAEKQARQPDREHPPWYIGERDIVAEVEAVLTLNGIAAALTTLRRWRPHSAGMNVARILVPCLIMSGKAGVVEECLDKHFVREPWNLALLVPLAAAGRPVDLARFEGALAKTTRHRIIDLARLGNDLTARMAGFWLDTIMTACEIVVGHGGNRDAVTPILAQFANEDLRSADRLRVFHSPLLDLQLRAHCLLQQINGRSATMRSFIVDLPEAELLNPEGRTSETLGSQNDRLKDLQRFLDPLLKGYDSRAQIIAGGAASENALRLLKEAAEAFRSRTYGSTDESPAGPSRRLAAVALANLISLHKLGSNAVLHNTLSIFGDRRDPLGSDEIAVFWVFALDRSLHEHVLSTLADRAEKIRAMRTVASEKVNATLRLCRFLVPISRQDAEALFHHIHKLTEEIDVDIVHQLRAVAALAMSATGAAVECPRLVARDVASAATDAAIRLPEHERLPWDRIAQALAVLNLPVALATVARWDDSGVVSRQSCLPTILEAALVSGTMTATQVIALLPLLVFTPLSLLEPAVHALDKLPSEDKCAAIDMIAKDEVLQFGSRGKDETLQVLGILSQVSLPQGQRGLWFGHFEETCKFVYGRESVGYRVVPTGEAEFNSVSETLPGPALPNLRFVKPTEVTNTIKQAMKEARTARLYQPMDALFEAMRRIVPLADRVSHLDTLSAIAPSEVPDLEIERAIVSALETWSSPAVQAWCERRLPSVIIERLPGFARGLQGEDSPLLTALLRKLPAETVPKVLVEAIARHVDELAARTVYWLVALIAQYTKPKVCGDVLPACVRSLSNRIAASDQDPVQLEDIPVMVSPGIARFLWALLSDCDVRTRWRAAHAVRHLARFGDTTTVSALLDLYDRTSDGAFRSSEAPFYWQAARLWLLIAVDRIATESPTSIAAHGSRLLAIATDDSFPHVLIRAFAKEAACKLLGRGLLVLTSDQRSSLEQANVSPVPKQSLPSRYGRPAASRRTPRSETRQPRFDFDTIDTLPYWYQPAAEMFVDVSVDELTDSAEIWIVDHWKPPLDVWRWDQEPRQKRFPERQWRLWSNDHGGAPTLERYSTYLEWHGMWCAVGELMKSRPFAEIEPEDYGSFNGWLAGRMLAHSPWWLADLRTPKPLEDCFWKPPMLDAPSWINSAEHEDFLRELGIGSSRPGMLVARAWHSTRSSRFDSDTHLSTALVAPETSSALVRALQTVPEPMRYKIPDEGDRFEIDEPPYRLIGWIGTNDPRSGIDEGDTFRNEVRGFHFKPGSHEESALTRRTNTDGTVSWLSASGAEEYLYEEWSDTRSGQEARYSYEARSDGARMWVSVDHLCRHLDAIGLDLIVEVRLTRRKADRDDYRRYDPKETASARYDRVFILRRDGSIEGAEGCVGTWHALGPRARA